MPLVLVNHSHKIEAATLEQTRDILYEGIAAGLSFEGGAMTAQDVRILLQKEDHSIKAPGTSI